MRITKIEMTGSRGRQATAARIDENTVEVELLSIVNPFTSGQPGWQPTHGWIERITMESTLDQIGDETWRIASRLQKDLDGVRGCGGDIRPVRDAIASLI